MDNEAVRPNLYCSFCGILLRYHLLDPYSTTLNRSWVDEVRAVYVRDSAPENPCVSGVGLITYRKTLLAPLDIRLSDKETDLQEEISLFRASGDLWGYGFHNACWSSLLYIIPDLQSSQNLQHILFNLLHDLECPEFSCLSFGHDYGGAATTHKTFGLPKEVDQSLYFYADPEAIPSPTELEGLSSGSNSFSPPLNPFSPTDVTDVPLDSHGMRIFISLPLEILWILAEYLPLKAVLGLRLVCRHFARVFHCNRLPQSFWKSRFMIGSEMFFVFPNLHENRIWSQLYFGTRACLEAGNQSLMNRKRILCLIEPVAHLVELTASGLREPCGLEALGTDHCHSGNQINTLTVKNEQDIPISVETVQVHSGELVPETSQLTYGCHVHSYRAAEYSLFQLAGIEDRSQKFTASSITIGSQRYISGITWTGPKAGLNNPCGIGYSTPYTDSFDIPCCKQLGTVEVAFCRMGLVGIRCNCPHGEPSRWVGEYAGRGIARGVLRISSLSKRYGFISGLDAFKIVSIGVFVPQSISICDEDSATYARRTTPIPAERYLWYNGAPTSQELTIGSVEPHLETPFFDPFVNIGFGGLHGELLSLITRMVVHMGTNYHPVLGFEFVYLNRTLRFGSIGGETELSVLIDGPGGERITGVKIIVCEGESGMRGLQIETSRGHTHVFADLPRHGDILKKLRPRLTNGHAIVGFVATLAHSGDYFERLGFQSEPQGRNLVVPNLPPARNPAHHLREFMFDYDNNFSVSIRTKNAGVFRTHASLNRVRRISASSGIPQRSRPPSHISGLRFDYWGQCDSLIVGQWMQAHPDDDSFEIVDGERIERLTIWLSKDGSSARLKGFALGRVVAVDIGTSHSRTKLFKPQGDYPVLADCQLTQYQSNGYEELTGISWILNSCYDRVHAIATPKAAVVPFSMVPRCLPPLDQFQKLFFDNHDGHSDMVRRIIGHFHCKFLKGITFCYGPGKSKYLGSTETEHQRDIDILEGERIPLFSVGKSGKEILYLEFQIELIHGLRSESRTVKLIADAEVEHQETNLIHQEIFGSSSALATNTVLRQRSHYIHRPPSNSNLVGISACCQEFSIIGAVFKPDSTENMEG
ncbi:hypothetical protein FQN54_004974 [Arachnomyces sp. PD_36]|nr:hypothetical protein FQN54_004974 [Arachnomyces sp. PD_36]